MPEDQKEPQSYGSQNDWATGRTGETVGNPSGDVPAEHAEFYDSRREKETSGPDQGGLPQPKWTDDVDVMRPVATASDVDDPSQKVTAIFGGAKREGFFKKRDYE